jgi:hypothetical protein
MKHQFGFLVKSVFPSRERRAGMLAAWEDVPRYGPTDWGNRCDGEGGHKLPRRSSDAVSLTGCGQLGRRVHAPVAL